MKAMILATLMTTGAYAQTATEAFRHILPYDTFHGQTLEGEDCVVDVLGSSEHTIIEVEAFGITRFKLVNSAPFTMDQARRAFKSSMLMTNSSGSQSEITFTTEDVNGKLRVAIQRTHRVDDRQWTSIQECSI